VRETVNRSIYRLGFALLDREDPTRVLRRTDQWIFGPEDPYERGGQLGNVVFPCGWILQGDELRLYYGGADSCVSLAIAGLSDVVNFVKHCPDRQCPRQSLVGKRLVSQFERYPHRSGSK